MENLEHRVAESRTEQIQIVMPGYTNGNGRLFGGKLVAWMDVVAAVTARRHAHRDVTTVSIDNLQFKKAAYANDTVLLIGQITHVGVTSMEVRVEAFVERLDGSKELVEPRLLSPSSRSIRTSAPPRCPAWSPRRTRSAPSGRRARAAPS